MTNAPDENEEGIMVSFGDAPDGGGKMQEEVAQPQVSKPASVPVTTPKPTKQDYMTSTDPNALAIAEQKKKEKKEKEALEKQRIEEARKAAEEKRKKQEAIDKADALMGSMGNNSGSTGSGTTSGNTNQGNPLGSGTSGGNSWSLNGRSLSGKLVQPSYDNDVEGRITVNIRVDANGNVTSASIGSPTNISDTQTRNAALSAARSTRFTSGKGDASGSITYNFKLR